MNKLISTDLWLLTVYETRDAALAAFDVHLGGPFSALAPAAAAVTSRSDAGARWSMRLNCHVWHSERGDIFLVLEEDKDKKLLKVLHGNRVGWIFDYDWLELKEAKERSKS